MYYYLLLYYLSPNNLIYQRVIYIFKYFIASLITLKKIKETNEEICAICLEKIKEPVRPDNCQHIFCCRCFEVYIQSFDRCPTCKITFNKFLPLYDRGLLRKKNIGLFDGNLEDKIYRFEQFYKNHEHCVVCKKTDNPEFMILCDRCYINKCHYYCDINGGLAFNCYICPICRRRFYGKIRKNKINKK